MNGKTTHKIEPRNESTILGNLDNRVFKLDWIDRSSQQFQANRSMPISRVISFCKEKKAYIGTNTLRIPLKLHLKLFSSELESLWSVHSLSEKTVTFWIPLLHKNTSIILSSRTPTQSV